MVALVVKYSSIGVGSRPFIQSNINFDSSNLYRSSSFSILLRINNSCEPWPGSTHKIGNCTLFLLVFWWWFAVVCLPAFHRFHRLPVSSQILVVVCGSLWWFAVVCNGLRWFVL